VLFKVDFFLRILFISCPEPERRGGCRIGEGSGMGRGGACCRGTNPALWTSASADQPRHRRSGIGTDACVQKTRVVHKHFSFRKGKGEIKEGNGWPVQSAEKRSRRRVRSEVILKPVLQFSGKLTVVAPPHHQFSIYLLLLWTVSQDFFAQGECDIALTDTTEKKNNIFAAVNKPTSFLKKKKLFCFLKKRNYFNFGIQAAAPA